MQEKVQILFDFYRIRRVFTFSKNSTSSPRVMKNSFSFPTKKNKGKLEGVERRENLSGGRWTCEKKGGGGLVIRKKKIVWMESCSRRKKATEKKLTKEEKVESRRRVRRRRNARRAGLIVEIHNKNKGRRKVGRWKSISTVWITDYVKSSGEG